MVFLASGGPPGVPPDPFKHPKGHQGAPTCFQGPGLALLGRVGGPLGIPWGPFGTPTALQKDPKGPPKDSQHAPRSSQEDPKELQSASRNQGDGKKKPKYDFGNPYNVLAWFSLLLGAPRSPFQCQSPPLWLRCQSASALRARPRLQNLPPCASHGWSVRAQQAAW